MLRMQYQYHIENVLGHNHKAGRVTLWMSCGTCFVLPNPEYFSGGAFCTLLEDNYIWHLEQVNRKSTYGFTHNLLQDTG